MSQRDDDLPDDLQNDLSALYRQAVPGDARRDQQILHQSLMRLRWGHRRRWLLGAGGAMAAAAAVVLIVLLHKPPMAATPQFALFALGNPPPQGQVDILTAFRLSKALKLGQHPSPAWDRIGDGVIDQRDVDAWAKLAVRIDAGATP